MKMNINKHTTEKNGFRQREPQYFNLLACMHVVYYYVVGVLLRQVVQDSFPSYDE